MAWTYSGDPDSSALDAIRFLCGDTDTNDQLLANEEISWINSQITGSTTATTAVYACAYRACITIASKFSREASKSVGDLSISAHQKAESYRKQALELKALVSREGGVPTPYAGGISISDKNANQENSNVYQAWFQSGQFDNQRGGGVEQIDANFGAGAD